MSISSVSLRCKLIASTFGCIWVHYRNHCDATSAARSRSCLHNQFRARIHIVLTWNTPNPRRQHFNLTPEQSSPQIYRNWKTRSPHAKDQSRTPGAHLLFRIVMPSTERTHSRTKQNEFPINGVLADTLSPQPQNKHEHIRLGDG